MKRLILEDEESKIYLNDVTKNDIIAIKDNIGNYFGVITYGKNKWHSIDGMGTHDYDTISDAIQDYNEDVKFYVLD